MHTDPSSIDEGSSAQLVESVSSPAEEPTVSPEDLARQQRIVAAAIAGLVLLLVVLGVAVYLLLLPTTDTARVRDIFIILLALESLLIGISLIVLLFQLARLINLLQNEIKPILESTQNAVNTLRGTTAFLSDNMVEPVIKLNEYMASLRSLFEFVRFTRRR